MYFWPQCVKLLQTSDPEDIFPSSLDPQKIIQVAAPVWRMLGTFF